MTNLQQLLHQLDTELVEQPQRDATWAQRIPATAYQLYRETFYLSDHGLSQVYLSDTTGLIGLTYRSTQVVKDRWPRAAELVDQINQLCQRELRELGLFE